MLTYRLRNLAKIVAGWALCRKRMRVWLYSLSANIEIAPGAALMPGCTLGSGPISIGENCFINQDCIFDTEGGSSITLEANVLVAARVIFSAVSHDIGPPTRRAKGFNPRQITVRSGTWIGASVVVLSGVTIAEGCVIGAGSVVTRDTEPNGVYVGIPARRVREL